MFLKRLLLLEIQLTRQRHNPSLTIILISKEAVPDKGTASSQFAKPHSASKSQNTVFSIALRPEILAAYASWQNGPALLLLLLPPGLA